MKVIVVDIVVVFTVVVFCGVSCGSGGGRGGGRGSDNGSLQKKNLNVNFFRICLDPPTKCKRLTTKISKKCIRILKYLLIIKPKIQKPLHRKSYFGHQL